MIKRIEISNFLSHKAGVLDLDPGVNIIVGATDSGKSAIIRALRWVVENRPLGDAFRSYWGGNTAVSIHTEQGTVTRLKTNKDNQYHLEQNRFYAIKSEVPDEVKAALNLTDVNLQTQFESHFLLARSPGEVAQHWNRIAHLDKIDVGLQNLNRWAREIQHALRADTEYLERLQEELVQYEDIDIIEEKVGALEEMNNSVMEHKNQAAELIKLKGDIVYVDRQIETSRVPDGMEQAVDKALGFVSQLRDISDARLELDDLLGRLGMLNDELYQLEGFIKAERLVDGIIKLDARVNDMADQADALEVAINYVKKVDAGLAEADRKLGEMEKQFHKNMGETCPLCGQKIKNNKF